MLKMLKCSQLLCQHADVYQVMFAIATILVLCVSMLQVQVRLMGMSLCLQVFGHKLQYWTNCNFNLMMALDEQSGGHQSQLDSSCDCQLNQYYCLLLLLDISCLDQSDGPTAQHYPS